MRHGLSSSHRLGVDLVEFKKAERFYNAHKDKLTEILSPREISFVRGCKKPHEALAMIFGAKEAFFKASGTKDAGLLQFRAIETIPGKNKFSYKLRRSSKNCLAVEKKFAISFIRAKKFVVVQCHSKEINFRAL